MSLFHWTAEHDVFLPEIDAEHRALFVAGEDLHRALSAGAGPDKIKEGMHHLLQMVEAHFLHEEQLMQASEFESFEWHRTQHNSVRKRAEATDPGDALSVTGLLEYTASWLRDHTAVADRIMAAHVRNWARRRAA